MNLVTHELWAALRFVGMRDRLRCPRCGKVGTWKPHGGWYDRRHGDSRAVRRWLCKWCGLYRGPEGELDAFPSTETGAWALPGWAEREPTPAEAIESFYGRSIDPWRG